MAGELKRWQNEIRDLGFLPEGEMHERRGKLTPYELGRDNNKYPLDEIRAAAEIATRANESNLKEIKDMMKHQDPAIRYWGATGCIVIGKDSKSLKSDLMGLLKDACPDVRTASAHALFSIGHPKEAVPVLEKILSEKNQFYRLRAMNVLDHMDENAREAVARIARVGDSAKIGAYGENYIGNVIKKAASDLGIKTSK